ncbi:MAG TPA: maleylpyruvate isomerase family mycothiol-dependent enzyme [Acidimicrobiia bacterium]|nr:maleylpyruvate isomerase family mycothiol-dependent enzyme [Acidimicrobiia bacterium]
MAAPSVDLLMVRDATRRVLRSIDELSDEQAHAPSRLPGWNRAEVLTHLARNADGVRNMVEGALRSEETAMYPGGTEQRAAGIAAGRDEPAATLRLDVRRASDRLAEAFGQLQGDAWNRTGMASRRRTMRELPWVRLREVEIHHVDLDLGYEPGDWPVTFVSGALDEIMTTLSSRAIESRPRTTARYRVVTTDHERAWRVELHDDDVIVGADEGGAVDGEVRGWGCDVAAWFYGRDVNGGSVTASGDPGVLQLPRWFPFA